MTLRINIFRGYISILVYSWIRWERLIPSAHPTPAKNPGKEKRPGVRALSIKLAEEEGFPRRYATLDPSFASSVGRNPENVPLARFLNGFPPHRFESPAKDPGKEKRPGVRALSIKLAEEEGFEPSSPGIRVKRFSRPPHSTTLPPLRVGRDQRKC